MRYSPFLGALPFPWLTNLYSSPESVFVNSPLQPASRIDKKNNLTKVRIMFIHIKLKLKAKYQGFIRGILPSAFRLLLACISRVLYQFWISDNFVGRYGPE